MHHPIHTAVLMLFVTALTQLWASEEEFRSSALLSNRQSRRSAIRTGEQLRAWFFRSVGWLVTLSEQSCIIPDLLITLSKYLYCHTNIMLNSTWCNDCSAFSIHVFSIAEVCSILWRAIATLSNPSRYRSLHDPRGEQPWGHKHQGFTFRGMAGGICWT